VEVEIAANEALAAGHAAKDAVERIMHRRVHGLAADYAAENVEVVDPDSPGLTATLHHSNVTSCYWRVSTC
jgi:hypothetical protein